MIVLALDTTMSGCSVCLYDDDERGTVISKSLEMVRGQAEHLIPMIDDIVDDYSQIDLIAVTKGPGAFTGMRIGLSTAKALGLALNIPVIGVTTFNAVLKTYLSVKSNKTYPYYGVLLETKRDDYYFQLFEGEAGISATAKDILSIIGDRECIILGDACQRFKDEISHNNLEFYDISLPSPLEIAKIALLEKDNGNCGADCNPIYLRMPEIGISKNLPRKLKSRF